MNTSSNTHRELHFISVGIAVLLIAAMAPLASAQVTGAVFTTNSNCQQVDGNIYVFKQDVFVDGGPHHPGSAGLPAGDYYVQVTEPEGALLGTSVTVAGNPTPVHVDSNGNFAACYELWLILRKASSSGTGAADGYNTTTNPGREYKVWVSQDPTFTNSLEKSDNFKVDNPEITATKTCTPNVFVGDTISYQITVTNTGSIDLVNVTVNDNLLGGSLPAGGDSPILDNLPIDTMSVGETWTYARTLTATSAGQVLNSVTASGADSRVTSVVVSSTSDCPTLVWALNVSKTASTSFIRDWSWTVTKSVAGTNPDPLVIPRSASGTVSFSIVTGNSFTDHDWKVSGTISVSNPAPISVTVNSLVDAGASVDCGQTSFPTVLAGGGSFNCTYSANKNNADAGTNTATATIANNNSGTTSFSGSADFSFGDPSVENHKCVTLSDALTCPTGFSCSGSALPSDPICAPSAPSFSYDVTVTNVSATCDTVYSVDNAVRLVEGISTLASGSASASFSTGPCGPNCTLTIGYWKTHAGFTGNNPDRVTQFLPKLLGSSGGTKTVTVSTATMVFQIESMIYATSTNGPADPSNGVTKLYAQLLGAKLNIARGASPTAISSTISSADSFLANKNQSDWLGLTKTQRNNVLTWMSTLDAYNNGLLTGGPPHCD